MPITSWESIIKIRDLFHELGKPDLEAKAQELALHYFAEKALKTHKKDPLQPNFTRKFVFFSKPDALESGGLSYQNLIN